MKLTNMFYFATEERKLRYEDNRAIVVGETHEVSGKIELCHNGLHASKCIKDALIFAPGPILYLVELSGEIVKDADKCAASKRKYIAEFDATEVLRKFARKQALINIELIKPYSSTDDYNLIVKYLESGDEEIRIKVARAAAAIAAIAASAKAASAKAAIAAIAASAQAASAAARAVVWAAKAAAWAAEVAEAAAAAAAAWASESAKLTIEYEKSMSEANIMLTNMIREATGWDI